MHTYNVKNIILILSNHTNMSFNFIPTNDLSLLMKQRQKLKIKIVIITILILCIE